MRRKDTLEKILFTAVVIVWSTLACSFLWLIVRALLKYING